MLKKEVGRGPGGAILIMDSITKVAPTDRGAVVVSASHGGASSGEFALEVPLKLVFFNDAGADHRGRHPGQDHRAAAALHGQPDLATRGHHGAGDRGGHGHGHDAHNPDHDAGADAGGQGRGPGLKPPGFRAAAALKRGRGLWAASREGLGTVAARQARQGPWTR